MPAKHDQMRNTNTLLILEHIRKHGGSTRRSIQQATELSWATVSNISAELVSNSVLYEQVRGSHVVGRNPEYLDFVPMQNLTVGIELSAGGITVLLVDLRGNIVGCATEPCADLGREQLISQMLDCVDRLIQRFGIKHSSLLGIGIATQGSVDRDGATSLYNSFFRDWRNVPLKEICEKRFGVPTHVMHDPVCMALAEQWARRFTEEDDFSMIRLSYGIGMSHIVRGNPVTGSSGFAGELGHMVLDRNGPRCSCGNRGCLESYSSLRGIAWRILELAQKKTLELPEYLRQMDRNSLDFMRDAVQWAAEEARSGNAAAKALFMDAGYYLGTSIANIINLFNPKYVILSGSLLQYADLLGQTAQDVAKELSWEESECKILIAPTDRKQAAMGAALYYINNAFNSLESRLLEQVAAV